MPNSSVIDCFARLSLLALSSSIGYEVGIGPLTSVWREQAPTAQRSHGVANATERSKLIDKLNEDLSREYQAIIAYVVYSQTLKGAEYMNIAKELEAHAGEELQHALKVAKHIDYLGGTPSVTAYAVKQAKTAEEMLRADLENETKTIEQYRERVRQCEALGEYGIGEDIREILRQEQEHQLDLATALGEDVPGVEKRSGEKKSSK